MGTSEEVSTVANDSELTPRYNPELGRYEWGAPEASSTSVEPPPAIEPAFVRQAVQADFDPPRHDVTTFADTYPRGTKGSVSLYKDAQPEAEPEFDALADWRVPGEVADSILISLPDGTPRILRTMLTLLIGAMRGGPRHAEPSQSHQGRRSL